MDRLSERYPPLEVSDADDIGINPTHNTPFCALTAPGADRRSLLKGLLAGAAATAAAPLMARAADNQTDPSTLRFDQPPHEIGQDQRVAPGYSAAILIRWGDAVLPDAPQWQPGKADADAQARQFGYNNDYLAFMPLPFGSNSSDHGLLFANHEYTSTELMLRDFPDHENKTPEQIAFEMAGHGASLIEVRRDSTGWRVITDSPYARRIDLATPMRISGPAAGHARLRTGYDPQGRNLLGTLNNCSGGKTPWGTVLTAEENFHQYFGPQIGAEHPEWGNYKRYGVTGSYGYRWDRAVERFDLNKEPNEANRFGWVVEIDPYDPAFTPIKRTAMGRFKHEAATTVINPDGRVVVYSGDDERFDYLYKFVTARPWNPSDRKANFDLLDEGTLYVARFGGEGTVDWLPLVYGDGPLTPENGFESQADVVIEARRAADLRGATPMDRPEDVEASPINGRVYVNLTNNTRRTAEQVDAANPRPNNKHGHILELIPPGGDGRLANHAAERFSWKLLLLAGDPTAPEERAIYHPKTQSWLSSPDNIAFDPSGRLWIATDQGSNQAVNGIPDGLYACDVDGAGRALVKFFYGCPAGAEMCGPEFTPDGKTLFVAVQHPGDGKNASFDRPATRWPDFQDGVPPRPAVVAITQREDGYIGT